MGYCVPEDVRRVLRGSAADDDGGTAAELEDDQISLEIENGQAQIDSTLRGTYKVPFTKPYPAMIKALNVDIAAYLADLNYRKSREYESDNYPIVRRYNRAREMLEWLRTGIMKLEVAENNAVSGSEVFHMYDGPQLLGFDDAFANRYRDW